MTEQTLYLGPPGTGKTTTLLNLVEMHLNNEVEPNKIAYVSFTRKAAQEAVNRACDKFNFEKKQLPYFRTLHSLAFQELRLNKADVMSASHYQQLGKMLGVGFSIKNFSIEEGIPMGSQTGDKLMQIDNLARVRMVSIKEQWKSCGFDSISFHQAKQFSETLKRFKDDVGLIDFTGMLEKSLASTSLSLDVVIIDEAQDLSRLQWAFVNRIFNGVPVKYIAGDDDQSIYRWSGADIDTFLNLEGKKKVLNKSYRLPQKIFKVAKSITDKIKNRYDKQWLPKDKEGSIEWIQDIDQLDLKKEGSWLLLGRNNFMLQQFEDLVKQQGWSYIIKSRASVSSNHRDAIVGWEDLRKGKQVSFTIVKLIYKYMMTGHIKRGFKNLKTADPESLYDIEKLKEKHGLQIEEPWFESLNGIALTTREYYRQCMRNGERLNKSPRIHINTIHGVKGGEADNVVLLTDMAYQTYKSYLEDPDDEHRVFYVGVTRAKQKLMLVAPQTPLFYEIFI